MFNVIDCIGRSIALAALGSATDQIVLGCNRTVAFDRRLPATLERATKIPHRQNIVFVETIVVGQRSTLCDRAEECPLSGVKRTSQIRPVMSASDPKRTFCA